MPVFCRLSLPKQAKLTGCPIHPDSRIISTVAHTIGLSFSHDPFIRWLRPAAPPWERSRPDTYRWEYRYVQQAMLDGMVFRSMSVMQLVQTIPSKEQKSNDMQTAVVQGDIGEEGTDAGSVVFLVPPKKRLRWTITRTLYALKLWLLDILDTLCPGPDNGGEKVCSSLGIFCTRVSNHSSGMRKCYVHMNSR